MTHMTMTMLMNMSDDELVVAARRMRAEYALLAHFDKRRRAQGHDYGGGQRWKELERRLRELVRAQARLEAIRRHEEATAPPTHAELVEAFARIGRPRLARLRSESYRRHTSSSRKTEKTWASLESFYGGVS